MAAQPEETVGVVLVSHSGESWLGAVLDGLEEQTVLPTALAAVDTGSKDGSVALLQERVGEAGVVTLGRQTSYAQAVAAGVELLHTRGAQPRWLWLLHDDSRPAPEALARLLEAARQHPEAAILGPKLREWPSLRRLLELGVTISGTGRRETGLERGEYDQGQHDDVRRVLAVNTAGMLVRTDVWRRLGGFDDALPVFGNDIDLGWRAANAGETTLIVPQAVVFHVEAAHRGIRRTPLTGRHTHYQERRAALYTLLANAPGRTLPWQIVRLTFATMLRALGFLLLRSIGEAADELAAWVNVLARPGQVRAARRDRARLLGGDEAAAVAQLRPPWWLPYRHGLDNVSDFAEAATNQAQDVAERRRAAALVDAGPGALPAAVRSDLDPLDDDEDDVGEDTGLVARFLTSPVALGLAALVVAMLVGTRSAWGRVSGAGLSAAPERAADWWQLYAESTHPLALGTQVVAPAYTAVLAALGTVLGGSGPAAVSAVLLASMPLALWGTWRLLRVIGRFLDPVGAPRWLVAAGSATYALTPAVSGLWGDGRLGPIVTTALFPWFAHALLGFADPEPERRWRAAWRTGVLLTVITAFAPSLYVFAVLLAVLVIALAAMFSRSLLTDRSVSAPPLLALSLPVLLLVPWWWPLLTAGDGAGLLLEPGRVPPSTTTPLELLGGKLADAAPGWLVLPLGLAAIVALLHPRSRPAALLGWLLVAVAALAAVLVTTPTLDLRVGDVRASSASLLPVLVVGLVVAAVSLGLALVRSDWGSRARLRTPVGACLIALALAMPVLGAGWFAVQGGSGLSAAGDDEVPAYMRQRAALGPEHGVLLVRGTVEDGFTYWVRRGDGATLGEDEVLALTPPDADFVKSLSTLAMRPAPAAVRSLADAGVEYVVFPEPADGRVAAHLDATTGLSQASAENRRTRAWKVDLQPSTPFHAGAVTWGRGLLLAAQAIAVLVALVLCGPSRPRRRREPDAEVEVSTL